MRPFLPCAAVVVAQLAPAAALAQPPPDPTSTPTPTPGATSSAIPAPAPTSAPTPPLESLSPGPAFGVRGAFGLPLGSAKATPLSDIVKWVVPLGVDAGYFFDSHLYVGAYFVYGFASAASTTTTCADSNNSCSASEIRFGAVADWHFLPYRSLDPWAGAGLGYDIVNLNATDQSGATAEAGSLHGFDLTLRGGVEWKPPPSEGKNEASYGLGPFVDLAVGHYASDGSATTTHAWLTIGFRIRSRL